MSPYPLIETLAMRRILTRTKATGKTRQGVFIWFLCAAFLPLATASDCLPAEASFEPTVPTVGAPPGDPPTGMVWISGGRFSMGSKAPAPGVCDMSGGMPDAQPIHRVYVDGFWMDRTDVTNAQFAEFVQATGYITIAERKPSRAGFPRRASR